MSSLAAIAIIDDPMTTRDHRDLSKHEFWLFPTRLCGIGETLSTMDQV